MMGCNPACDCIKKWAANGKSSAFPATKDTFSCPFCFIKTFAFSNICSVKSSATTSSNMGANIFATCPPTSKQHQEDDYYDETQLVELHIVNPVL